MRHKGLAAMVGLVVLATSWAGRTADLETTASIARPAETAREAGRAGVDLGLSRLYGAGDPVAPAIVWQPSQGQQGGALAPQPAWDALLGVTPADRSPLLIVPGPRADRGIVKRFAPQVAAAATN